MERQNRDEKTVKAQILLLMEGEKEGVSFETLLSLLDLSENDLGYLHLILLDLCMDGSLKLNDAPCDSMNDMIFFPGKIPENTGKTEVNAVIRTDAREVSAGDAEQITDKLSENSGSDEKVMIEQEAGSEPQPAAVADEYTSGLYDHLIKALKNNPKWMTVRDLLSRDAWPKDACNVLAVLLVQMASEGIINIRTVRDSITGVRPEFRFCGGSESRIISNAVLAILNSIQSPVTETDEPDESETEAVSGTEELPEDSGADVETETEQTETEATEESEETEDPDESDESDVPEEKQELPAGSEEAGETVAEAHDDDGAETEQISDQEEQPDAGWQERSQIPYGYRDTPDGFAVVESEAEVVRAIFKMRSRKMILQSIADRLNAAGMRTKTGKLFYAATVGDILRKAKLYQGKSIWNGRFYPVIVDDHFLNRYNPLSDSNETDGSGIAAEEEKKPAMPLKKPESVPEPEQVNVPAPTSQEEIQEEIFRVLFENPGYHSVEVIKQLSARLKQVPDYKIIFNANTLHARNLIDEIITSPPDPVMYLYAAKGQPAAQRETVKTEEKAESQKKTEAEIKGKKTSDSREGREFINYCWITPLSYAYKMILILAFMQNADMNGTMHIDDAVLYFRKFYMGRRNQGLMVEKGNTVFADPDATDSQLRRNIIENPVKALSSGGYFKYDAQNKLFSMKSDVWMKLDSWDKDEIMRVCNKRLDGYFSLL